MSFIKDHLESNNLNRVLLVGTNSQGKTFSLVNLAKENGVKDHCVFISTEVKADENLKNSADSSTLILWLNSLLNIDNLKTALDSEIGNINFEDINKDNFITIGLTSNISTCKGLVNAEISTKSNHFKQPGSGERFLGQLYLISKILEENKDGQYNYLIVDEPERHLHKSLFIKVAQILNKISKQGIKVVLSTHSPIIVKYFIDDTNEIIKMKDGAPLYLPKKEELVNLLNNYNIYNDENYMMKTFKQIKDKRDLYFEKFVLPKIYDSLFCESIVLGEGFSDEEVINFALEECRLEKGIINVDLLITHGKDFMPWYIAILKKIDLNILCVYDLDDENDNKHKNLNNIISNEMCETLVFNKDLESEIGINTAGRCKVKEIPIEIREMYIKNDQKIIDVIKKIKDKIEVILK